MMNLWNDLKVSSKIGIGIGSIVLILGVVSILNYSNIGGIVGSAGEVIAGNKLDALLAQNEVDHLNWVNQVNALLTDETVTELNVELDDHQCEFGKWLYGEGRKRAEQLVPDLAPLFKAIEEPHRQLHASATDIKEYFRQSDASLPSTLLEREIDHLNWASSIRDSLLNNEPLTVQTDHTQCLLGQWIRSEATKKLVRRGDAEFKKAWKNLLIHHENLHRSAKDITSALSDSRSTALHLFRSKTLPALDATRSSIRELKEEAVHELSGMHKANTIYSETTMPSLKKIQTLLVEIRKTAKQNSITDEQMLAIADGSKNQAMIAGFIAIGIGILLTLLIARSISVPIIKGVNFAKTIASGNLTQRLNVDQKDEMGILANALTGMSEHLRKMFADISNGTQTLTSSSTELSAISEQMADNSEQTSEKANSVSAAADEMSTNMSSIAAATEQTTTNIQMIVSAAEEMTSTINEIAENTVKGNETTNKAVERARRVSEKVDDLGAAANDINKVTETISDISEKTSLLALNATIEAARAGEAGKGFTVVAGEIKALAQQTAEATNEISQKIGSVQATTKESVEAIQSIVEIINEIDTIMTTIATAIEEQSTTTQEIADNVSQAASGLADVNDSVNQTSVVTEIVTKDISKVSLASNEINEDSQQVSTKAVELSKLAVKLNEMVGKFTL